MVVAARLLTTSRASVATGAFATEGRGAVRGESAMRKRLRVKARVPTAARCCARPARLAGALATRARPRRTPTAATHASGASEPSTRSARSACIRATAMAARGVAIGASARPMRPVARDLGQPGRARSAPLVPRVFVRARLDSFGRTLLDNSLAMHVVAPLRLSRAWECTAGTARAGKGSAGKVRECLGAVGYPPTLHGRRPRASTRAGMGEGGAVCVVRLVAVPGAQAPRVSAPGCGFVHRTAAFRAIRLDSCRVSVLWLGTR